MINSSYAQEHCLDMCSERPSQTYVVKRNGCDFVLARGPVRGVEGVKANKDCLAEREAEASIGKCGSF